MEKHYDTICNKADDLVKSLDAAEPDAGVAYPAAEPDAEPEGEKAILIHDFVSRTCKPVTIDPKKTSSVFSIIGRAVWLLVVFLLIWASVRSNFNIGAEPTAAETSKLEQVPASAVDAAVQLDEKVETMTEEEADAETDAEADRQATDDLVNGDPGKLVSVALTRQVIPVHTVNNMQYFKSAYHGSIKAGSSQQEFKVVFDTGSGHLILPSRYCYSETCRAHQRYSRSQSTSAVDMDYDGGVVSPQDLRDEMTVSFGTGEVTGIFIQEIVCVNNDALKDWTAEEKRNISVNSQYHKELPLGCTSLRFIAATAMSEELFRTFDFDGVFGLGLPGISHAPAFNFLQAFSETSPSWGVTRQQMFAVFLAYDGHAGSEITFGGLRKDHLDGDVYWNDVVNPEVGHWIVRIKSIRVDDEAVDFCANGDCKAVADTGTSLLGVPVDAFSSMYRLMWHPGPLDGMCKGYGPKLHVELDEITITLGPEDYAGSFGYSPAQTKLNAEVPPPWGLPFSGGEEDRFGATRYDIQCRPMLMSMDHPEPVGPKLFILGEPVLRKYYTVYDTEKKRIGFGHANHDGEVSADEPVVETDDWFWEDDEDDSDGV